jgi:hypothetical protein
MAAMAVCQFIPLEMSENQELQFDIADFSVRFHLQDWLALFIFSHGWMAITAHECIILFSNSYTLLLTRSKLKWAFPFCEKYDQI